MVKGSTIGKDPFASLIPEPEEVPQPLEVATPSAGSARAREPEAPRPVVDDRVVSLVDVVAPAPEKMRPAPRAPARSPEPAEKRGREKLTVHMEGDLVNRIKNAAYWNPRLTIARIAEGGLRQAIEKIERENGGPYPQRESELIGGRPIK